MTIVNIRGGSRSKVQNACLLLLVVGTVLLATVCASTTLSDKPTTLIVIDNPAIKTTHSVFFNAIKDLGHKVEFINILESPLILNLNGQWQADNLVIFAPSLQDLGELSTIQLVTDFVDAGNSLIMASSSSLSEPLRALANSFGVDYDENSAVVTDTATDITADKSLTGALSLVTDSKGVVAPIFTAVTRCKSTENDNQYITGQCVNTTNPANRNSKNLRSVAFSGLAQSVTPKSKYVRPVLTGNPTTLSQDGDETLAVGENVVLVSAMQSELSSRAVFSGSLALFSNDFFDITTNGADNKNFAVTLMQWAFHARGYVRAYAPTHHKVTAEGSGETEKNPSSYRLKDDVRYEVTLQEYDGVNHKWVPFVSDRVVFELIMIDPYVREQLPHIGGGRYALTLRVPDVFGVYKFRISLEQFASDGAAFVKNDQLVSIRPFKHSEYDRFLLVAYPYYTGAFTIMMGFIVFSVLFLYSKAK